MRRLPNIAIMGMPGAGKGLQSRFLELEFGYERVCSGDILRAARREQDPRVLAFMAEVDKGNLGPSAPIMEVVLERMGKEPPFLYDGIPRRPEQIEYMVTEFPRYATLEGAVVLDIGEGVADERMKHRWICNPCGKPYRNPESLDCTCSGTLYQREDDKTPERRLRRIQQFHDETAPVIRELEELGQMTVVYINAERPWLEVAEDLQKYIAAFTEQPSVTP